MRQQAQEVGGWLFYIIDIFINACETEIMLVKYLNFILCIERHFKYWERLWILESHHWPHIKSYSLFSSHEASRSGKKQIFQVFEMPKCKLYVYLKGDIRNVKWWLKRKYQRITRDNNDNDNNNL